MIILNPKCSLVDFFGSLKASKRSMLILDYDGTLAPFSIDPNLAYPYPGMFDRIIKLMEMQVTKVVIISGRDIESLKKLLPSPFPELWGSHGGERLLVNSSSISVIPLKPEIKQILAIAAKRARELSSKLYIEIKPHSVALHWRGQNPKLAEPVKAYWHELLFNQEIALEIQSFDEGIELRVVGINKGYAVRQLLEEFPENNLIAYLGDDLTDEQAFEVLQDKALKILVRKELRPTLADLYIKPPEEVIEFLDCWLEAIGGVNGRKNP
jgi:trehalose 6-phosphate phosphatase